MLNHVSESLEIFLKILLPLHQKCVVLDDFFLREQIFSDCDLLLKLLVQLVEIAVAMTNL